MTRVIVQDAAGKHLSPCSADKAQRLVADGQADWLGHDPPIIQLRRVIDLPEPPETPPHPLDGRRTLLHICCAPCATYTVQHLRELGADVTGYWYNPNIHPFSEHEKRRQTLLSYAADIELPMMWGPPYELPQFLRMVCGREAFRTRCALCYRMRLERVAQAAADHDFAAFTTTLLISPYQDIDMIRQIGKELASAYGVMFYYENLRSGFAEHHRLAREHELYQQRYCGCIYSEWEALDRTATTSSSHEPE